MDLFSRTSKKRVELICDIGSGSVGVSFVEFAKGTPPNVLYGERVVIPPIKASSSEGMYAALSNEFRGALSRALGHAVARNIRPQRAHCFYSSPWFVAQSHILKMRQDVPFVFTEAMLQKMIKDGERYFLSAEEKYIAPLSLKDIRLVERRVTQIKLNGYETHAPFGKKAKSAEVAVFMSALSVQTVEKVEECIRREWALVPIEHHTWATASFAVIRNLHEAYRSFVVLRVSSEATDMALVHEGCLLDTMSFPMGERTIVRNIGASAGLDRELAQSALSLYLKKEIHKEYGDKLESSINTVRKDWLAHVEHGFGEILKDVPIPQILYVISDESMLAFFESALKKDRWNSYMLSGFEFQVYPIKKEMFEPHVVYTSSMYKDFVLDSEALYLDTLSAARTLITSNDYVIE